MRTFGALSCFGPFMELSAAKNIKFRQIIFMLAINSE